MGGKTHLQGGRGTRANLSSCAGPKKKEGCRCSLGRAQSLAGREEKRSKERSAGKDRSKEKTLIVEEGVQEGVIKRKETVTVKCTVWRVTFNIPLD